LCGSRKYPCPPQGRSLEIPREMRASKTKFIKGEYEAKLEFPVEWEGPNLKAVQGRSIFIL